MEFFIVLSLKTIKKFQRTNATAIRECCKRIHPIFPLLRIFPTYLSYPVNKTSQHFELRSQCTYCIFLVLICFLSICQMYFKRELCVTPATLYTCFKQIWFNISNVYLQTHWFQCDLLDDWHKNLWGGWSKSTSKYCSDLTLRILLPLSHFSLSDKTTVWLLHIIVNWVEWLWNPSDSFVICFCGPESAQRSKEFLSFWLCWPIKTLH